MTDPIYPAPTPLQPAYQPNPNPAFAPATIAAVPEDMLTEQEKDTSSSTKGVGPASASEGSPGPVETMEMLGIGPREPYPEGSPPPPSDADLANIEATKKAPAAKGPASDPFGNPAHAQYQPAVPPKGGA